MLTFLRKIRKSLLNSGDAQRYVLYAIGEIALVVIGILIALQINNWNEGRKEKAQIKVYLSGLIEALEDDINYLNYTIQGNHFRASCMEQIVLWAVGPQKRKTGELQYSVDDDWEAESMNVGWSNIWMDSIPQNYDRAFVEECFFRTSYGNVIVTNQFNIDEFKNSGLFSNIKNEALKDQINYYYAMMNWQFSLWREANYREKIDKWEVFLRNNHQLNYTDISSIEDPIRYINEHRDIQLELESLLIDAVGRLNRAGQIRESAKELIKSIHLQIQKL